ncbi:hypothetical protein K435DRAFT_929040 [Dendrothele bispora CBS 962.96]|uniref:BTB domain-containing protein n=1 Tax=Dendrothele bispora (strain CBS 962.96) TaxID=1314807 RepID=A0A4S8MFI7_DENBC|nr:hypothetical protein K435DRAFT_929040 [Dendrothele bispora CBS 962.96]
MQSKITSRDRKTSSVKSSGTIRVTVSGTTIDIHPKQAKDKSARSRREQSTPIRIKHSPKFSVDDPENDWLCLSSDSVLYGLRIENARVNSKGIYDPDSLDLPLDHLDWHIRLNIRSAVCDLLFEHMYNGPRTNLETISFETLIELTEAAEEYRVYSAIDCCKHALRKHVPTNPLEVMKIAAKHGYRDELLQAAPFAIDTPLPVMSTVLPRDLHMTWCRYREQFVNTHRFASESYPTEHSCQHWNGVLLGVLTKLRVLTMGSFFGYLTTMDFPGKQQDKRQNYYHCCDSFLLSTLNCLVSDSTTNAKCYTMLQSPCFFRTLYPETLSYNLGRSPDDLRPIDFFAVATLRVAMSMGPKDGIVLIVQVVLVKEERNWSNRQAHWFKVQDKLYANSVVS